MPFNCSAHSGGQQHFLFRSETLIPRTVFIFITSRLVVVWNTQLGTSRLYLPILLLKYQMNLD
jgi:hypothetical protein